MTPALIKEFCQLDDESLRLMQRAFEKFKYSARTFHKFLKLSRTFADLDGSDRIRKQDVANALMCRDLDKEQINMVVV